jgi:GntP family gluconate:H+ symporter
VIKWLDRAMPLPVRPYVGETEATASASNDLPPFWVAIAPVLLPVLLISANTIVKVIVKTNPGWQSIANLTGVIGDPNAALLLAAIVAMGTVVWKRRLSLSALGATDGRGLDERRHYHLDYIGGWGLRCHVEADRDQ